MFDYYVALKKSRTEEWVEAVMAGKKEPDFPWPHPDDILIDKWQRKYRIRGPFDAESVPLYQWIRAQRDLYHAKWIQAGRRKKHEAWIAIWALFTVQCNNSLPKRWQIDVAEGPETMRLILMTEAELQREIEQFARREAILNTAKPCRESYQLANSVMRPSLKRMGYRSLAQFERAYEKTGGNPPWPMRS